MSLATPMSAAEFDGPLADRWLDFVDCEARDVTMRPFLSEYILRGVTKPIIDLAAGVGCEVATIAKLGHAVVANEVSPHLRQLGQKRVSPIRALVTWTSYDWLNLGKFFEHESLGGAILLGNSLCLIPTKDEQERVAKELFPLVANGGRVAVDERNFRYIVDESRKIGKHGFRYGRRVVYCGTKVSGIPKKISPKRVEFEYTDHATKQSLGVLAMRPYGVGELVEIWERAGFRLVHSLSDLSEVVDPAADFYTYVFEKPLG